MCVCVCVCIYECMFVRYSHAVGFGFCVLSSVMLALYGAVSLNSNACLW